VTELKAGTRLRSLTSSTEVIVTMGSPGVLTCGGEPMVPTAKDEPAPEPAAAVSADDETILLGKRYSAPHGTLQVLCVRQGTGNLAVNGVPLQLIKPKMLAASD
jgi:hypothetical protein